MNRIVFTLSDDNGDASFFSAADTVIRTSRFAARICETDDFIARIPFLSGLIDHCLITQVPRYRAVTLAVLESRLMKAGALTRPVPFSWHGIALSTARRTPVVSDVIRPIRAASMTHDNLVQPTGKAGLGVEVVADKIRVVQRARAGDQDDSHACSPPTTVKTCARVKALRK